MTATGTIRAGRQGATDGPPPHGGYMTLVHVAGFHGVQTSAAKLSHALGLGDEVPDGNALARCARDLGLRARVVRNPNRRRLRSMPTPVMMRTREGTWRILGIETSPGIHRVVDPVSRREELLPLADVMAGLGDEVVLVGKALGAERGRTRFGLSWFTPVLGRYWRPIAHVLASSLFINVLGLASPLVFQIVVDKVLVSKSEATLDVVVVALLLIALASGALSVVRSYAMAHTGNRIDVELGAKLYAHLVRLPISFFERRPAGVVVTRMREVEQVRRFLTDQGLASAVDILFLFVYVAVLAAYSGTLTLGVLALTPLYAAIGALARPAFRRKVDDKVRRLARGQQLLVETVVGIQTVKASAVEPLFQREWEERLAAYVRSAFDAAMVGSFAQAGVQFVTRLTTVVVLYFGTRQVIAGSMTVGGLIAFSMISQRMAQPVTKFSQLYQGFQEAKVSIHHLADILDQEAEGCEGGDPPPASCKGALSLRDVTFRYLPELPPALRGVSLDVRPGEVIGIVGPSGSGKSTLTKLLQRFHDPDAGAVMVDGTDMRRLEPAWLRRQLGVVLQENFLFNATLHANIALARPDMSREHVARIARLAGVDEFASKLPRGYDTPIEERGANLSGGQRQRVAIARALATDPRILILDEATSALDYESERIIRRNMRRIAEGRTVVIIAHRLAAVRDCDRIVGMQDGRIVEVGTHDELLGREGGLYRRLWALQGEVAS